MSVNRCDCVCVYVSMIRVYVGVVSIVSCCNAEVNLVK